MTGKNIRINNKLEEGFSFRISRFKEHIKKTKPHKHEAYYEMIFLSEGEGFHCIESENHLISAPEFYYLKPGQLHFWQFTSIPKGFVILFKESEFDELKENQLVTHYKKLQHTIRLRFTAESYPFVILNELLRTYEHQGDFSGEIIHGLLRALFGCLLQISESAQGTKYPPGPFDKFQALLIKECPHLHKVHQYAALLNLTPQNLNAICRKHAQKSALALINEQLMHEAKRYILHTDNTINEIADILSFTDASNFVKFFKKHMGLTPLQFRQSHFQ